MPVKGKSQARVDPALVFDMNEARALLNPLIDRIPRNKMFPTALCELIDRTANIWGPLDESIAWVERKWIDALKTEYGANLAYVRLWGCLPSETSGELLRAP